MNKTKEAEKILNSALYDEYPGNKYFAFSQKIESIPKWFFWVLIKLSFKIFLIFFKNFFC